MSMILNSLLYIAKVFQNVLLSLLFKKCWSEFNFPLRSVVHRIFSYGLNVMTILYVTIRISSGSESQIPGNILQKSDRVIYQSVLFIYIIQIWDPIQCPHDFSKMNLYMMTGLIWRLEWNQVQDRNSKQHIAKDCLRDLS